VNTYEEAPDVKLFPPDSIKSWEMEIPPCPKCIKCWRNVLPTFFGPNRSNIFDSP